MGADSTRRAAASRQAREPVWRRGRCAGDHRAVTSTPSPADADRRRGLRRVGVLVVVASFVVIWGYVLWLTFVEGRAEPRDRLDDERFAEAAQDACAPSAALFASLPLASEVNTPEERADLLDEATDELERMVERLEGVVPPRDAEESRAVARWLADYRTLVRDRREYASAQRDPSHPRYDQPFVVTDRGGFQVDVLIEDFAHVNRMESCEPPDDVG